MSRGFAVWTALTAGLAAAQLPLDRTDPAAVARAYTDAVARADGPAALALTRPDEAITFMLRQMIESDEIKRTGGFFAFLAEWLALPAGGESEYSVGDAEPGEAIYRVQVQRRLTLAQTLVLVKSEDGTWAVDLRETLRATSAGRPSLLLEQIAQMERMRAQGQDVPVEPQPWECHQRVRELAQALNDYADEHDGKYPVASVWMDAIEPYLEGEKPFACPGHPDEEYSYAFNEALGEQARPKDWQEGERLPLVVCVGGNVPNAAFDPEQLRDQAGRHGKLNVYGTCTTNVHSIPEKLSVAELLAEDAARQACEQRLRSLVAAAKEYAKDHNGLLPGAATWCDDLRPYLANKAPRDGGDPFVCPSLPDARCTYAICAELAGADLTKLIVHRKKLLFIELDDVPPNTAATADQHGAGRHLNAWNATAPRGSCRAYLDGHTELRQHP